MIYKRVTLVMIRFAKAWLQKYDKFSASFTDQEVN